MNYPEGVDLSVANDSLLTHADDVDFAKIYASGKLFAYLKGTEDTAYTDPQFDAFVTRAWETPLLLGAYGFDHPGKPAKAQAEMFLKATEKHSAKLGLPPWLDLETREKKSAQQIVDHVCTWMDCHKSERDQTGVLYSYLGFLRSLVQELGGPQSAGAQALVKYPLALAEYTFAQEADMRGLPWGSWLFWQHAASAQGGPIGRCDGVKGMVDLNYFGGTQEDLEQLAGVIVPGTRNTPT